MITDEMLHSAAARSCEIYIDHLLTDYDPHHHSVVSKGFERKIRRLKRRADHPIYYQAMRRVAAIIVAVIVGGIVWLSIDINARAAFFGWIQQIVDNYLVYHFEGETQNEEESAEYSPEWLPNGYSKASISITDQRTRIVFTNEDDCWIRFVYMHNKDKPYLFIDTTDTEILQISINGYQGDLFLPKESSVAPAISWVGADDIVFFISGFVDEGELVRIAESVKRISD